jgi:hypothetical protein
MFDYMFNMTWYFFKKFVVFIIDTHYDYAFEKKKYLPWGPYFKTMGSEPWGPYF